MVTVTSTVPVPAGEVAVMLVALFTVNEAAAVAPKLTALAPVKFGAGDRDRGPARARPRRRAEAGDRRCGRRGVGELVVRRWWRSFPRPGW